MEDSEGEGEETEAEWLLPGPSSGLRRDPPGAVEGVSCYHGQAVPKGNAWNRIIVHLDLDCFYAQVEMICNPELRSKPLGVQQKYLVVTCNYEARNLGVKKLMGVKEAKEKCPDLVLVNGEDLTKYREFSYRVTELLKTFTPLVERLGFDENFVDITELVEKRLIEWKKATLPKIFVSGHVYNNQTVDFHDPMHVRLAVGSQIAEEMRDAMVSGLGLTGCAGVATNKVLSKLVSGTFKPNQQTVLLPENRQNLMARLDHLRNIPGIGFQTAKRLLNLGLCTVQDLQNCSAEILEKELGIPAAHLIQKLSWGEDHSPVVPSGAPQSLSDEDSFKKCSSEADVKKKIEELLTNLLERLYKDGRKPHTIRLTIRQYSATNKWFNRESRQCPVPSHLVKRIGSGDASLKTHLVSILMKLFRKMINVEVPFHLTLLNICFSNLKDPPASSKESIQFYLSQSSPSLSSSKVFRTTEDRNSENTRMEHQEEDSDVLSGERNTRCVQSQLHTPCLPTASDLQCPSPPLPAGIDYDVFNQLPSDIKEEIISSQKKVRDSTQTLWSHGGSELGGKPPCHPKAKISSISLHSGDLGQSTRTLAFSGIAPTNEEPPPERQKPHGEGSSQNRSSPGSKVAFPPSVDPKTFSELPAEMQQELLTEWKSQKSVSKMHISQVVKGTKKGQKSCPGSNSLLRYFKPR
ncbi:DNA polymerase iota isoform X2 [Ahaetulla prasina]|uniref:DNA polymerase iota isoform X2 n=1 Tax=Ahaetulla prasina TaxID=499056 RepID=UPI002648A73A|nr:DNA polymerase iota isoform X2 [Ahaetulla prasina]